MKKIIICYSRTGKTKLVAETIAKKLNCEIVEIKDKKNRSGIIRWLKAGRDATFQKPTETEPESFNFSLYDLIYIGTPVWAFKPTPAISTFINNCNLTNKKIILFLTAGGTFGKAVKILAEKIISLGGQIVGIILIKTAGKSREKIIKETEILFKTNL
ncbi:MAG: flavodoxin [Elusimicrobiota bacterium]